MSSWKNIILFDTKKNLKLSLNFFKTKIKFYGYEDTDFCGKETSKVESNHTCLAAISLDSVLKNDQNYYSQVFLNESKSIEKKVIRHITDYLGNSLMSLMRNKVELGIFLKR